MQTDFLNSLTITQAVGPVPTSMNLDESIRSVGVYEHVWPDLRDFTPSNFSILLSLDFQGVTTTRWHSRISPGGSPFSEPFYAIPVQPRYLTNNEQKIFQRALRRSVRVIANGRKITPEND
jgi:hypothetical protein